MAYVQKEGEGVLFKNTDRSKDSQPNAKGTITINGVKYWLSSWTNAKDDGEKFQKLKVTPQNENNTRAPVQPKSQSVDPNDDIPF